MPDSTAPTPTLPAGFQFVSARHFITNRGRAPVDFLTELALFGKKVVSTLPDILVVNDSPTDVLDVLLPFLGIRTGFNQDGTPHFCWAGMEHRCAALMELARVHAGRESSWNWRDGVDTTNARSMANTSAQESGIFDVSFDSEFLEPILKTFGDARGIDTAQKFILCMKADHELALEYYFRLMRISYKWAGPLIETGEESVFPYLSQDSMREFMGLLK